MKQVYVKLKVNTRNGAFCTACLEFKLCLVLSTELI